jgi:hypothetical protein
MPVLTAEPSRREDASDNDAQPGRVCDMAEGLVLEFDGVDRAAYDAVNERRAER